MKRYEGLPDKWMLFTPDMDYEGRKALSILNKLLDESYDIVPGAHYGTESYVSNANLPPIGIKIFTPTEFLNFELSKEVEEGRKPVMGDVAVRINGGAGSDDPEGKMYALHSETAKDNRFRYLKGWSMLKCSWRHATPAEKNAFKNGITNINDMVYEVDLGQDVITESYGMKVGDDIPLDVLNKWKNMGGHYYAEYSPEKGWRNDSRGESYNQSDLKVLEIKRIKGIHALRVSSGTYVKAEGFKEFLYRFDMPDPSVDSLSKGDIVVVVDKGKSSYIAEGDIGELSDIHIPSTWMKYKLSNNIGWCKVIRMATAFEKELYRQFSIKNISDIKRDEGRSLSSPSHKTPKEAYRIDVLDMLGIQVKHTYCKWGLSGIETGRLPGNKSQSVKNGHVPLIEVKRR
jgi:hypothetical protein